MRALQVIGLRLVPNVVFSMIRYCRYFPLISFIVVTRDYQGKRLNPHIGLLTKVIPPKLFLDIVLSSSADITRALRGQAKRLLSKLLETKWRERHCMCFDFVSLPRCFLHSQLSFCSGGLSGLFLLVCLFNIWPFIRF